MLARVVRVGVVFLLRYHVATKKKLGPATRYPRMPAGNKLT